MADWRFYGRQKEIATVRDIVTRKLFTPLAVVGRRGVGKTALLNRVADSFKGEKPMVIMEMPSNELLLDQSFREGVMASVRSGRLRAEQTAYLLDPPDPIYATNKPLDHFCNRVEHMIQAGIILVGDEFHNVEPLGLDSFFKSMIDRFRRIGGERPSGGLVVAGSHQQKMLEMLNHYSKPLYGRIPDMTWVGLLQAPVLLEIAAEHGWLKRPARFLTLFNAFGGLPELWQRFHKEQQADPTFATMSDMEWTRWFIKREATRLTVDPENERFDSSSFVTLNAIARDLLMHIAKTNPRGVRATVLQKRKPKDMPNIDWRTEFDRQITTLSAHLQLIDRTIWIVGGETRPRKLRIYDLNTLFQLTLLKAGSGEGNEAIESMVEAVARSEGYGLERLTREWLYGLPNYNWSEQSVRERGLPEIDAVAVRTVPPKAEGERSKHEAIALCGCKRDSMEHNSYRLDRDFKEFLEDQYPGHRRKQLLDIRLIAVSPDMTGCNHKQFAYHGIECMDIRGMAQSLGIDIDPPRPAEEVVPEPEATQRNEKSYRFRM